MSSSAETSHQMQYCGSAIILLLMFANGASNGWNSPSLLSLLGGSSPLSSGSISLKEASWMTSNICLGSIVGAPLFGWFIEKYGRKECAYAASILQVAGWLFIVSARNHYYLYISRFLVGFGGVAAFIVIPIYITEISDKHIRGFLGSMSALCSNCGVLMAFIAGAFLPCFATPWIFIPLNVAFLFVFMHFPETPIYLAKIGEYAEAEKSLLFYRGLPNTKLASTSVLEELAELKAICTNAGVEVKPSSITNKETEATHRSNQRIARKALIISQVIFLLQQLSGCFTLIQYSELIFQRSGSALSPQYAAITVALIQVIGSYISTLLIEKAGRRILLLVSSVGCGLGLAVFGTYFLLDEMYFNLAPFSWLPLVAFSFVIFIANCGIVSLTYLVASEILPNEVKTLGSSLGHILLNVVSFILMLYLPQVMTDIGLSVPLYVFSASCLLGAVFIYIYLPETKGRSFAEISALLEK